MREIKFRAFLKTELENLEGQEKTVSFYLNNFAVYDGGASIGISADEFYRQTSKLNLTKEWAQELSQHVEDNFLNEDWLNIYNVEAVEQYTGLKDRNGKEICEADIVKNDDGVLYEVLWRGQYAGFYLSKIGECLEYKKNFNLDFSEAANAVIVGNIHETPEPLEDKNVNR